ncbi:hypothetical protein niasHT_005800 [Heterodera trifolii]|uniref:Uncharacterized protein n=1 Tax=Heterodera trifolii TaxID=157864 RepID=A0ABD2LVF7_9BILA
MNEDGMNSEPQKELFIRLMANADYLQLTPGQQFSTFKWLTEEIATGAGRITDQKELCAMLQLLRQYEQNLVQSRLDSKREALERMLAEPEYLELSEKAQWHIYKSLKDGPAAVPNRAEKGGQSQQRQQPSLISGQLIEISPTATSGAEWLAQKQKAKKRAKTSPPNFAGQKLPTDKGSEMAPANGPQNETANDGKRSELMGQLMANTEFLRMSPDEQWSIYRQMMENSKTAA